MAIIKTLRLQDSARLGYHGIVIWALLFAIGCIHYALAAVPQTVTLTPNPLGTQEGAIFIQDAVKVTLTCHGDETPTKYSFKQDGIVVQTMETSTVGSDKLVIKEFNVSSAGTYLCNALNGDGNKDSAPTTFTLKCATEGNTGCGDHGQCVLENGNKFCKCRYNDDAVFASACDECNDHTQCTTDGKTKCSPDTPHPRKCVECVEKNNAGCNADGENPRCDATKPNEATCKGCKTPDKGCAGTPKPYCPADGGKCVVCTKASEGKDCKTTGLTRCNEASGTCVECDKGTESADCQKEGKKKCNDAGTCVQCIDTKDCPTSAPNCVSNKCSSTAGPTTGSGTGQTEQTSKASVTSSAGTVTSTACLVIASVVVALII